MAVKLIHSMIRVTDLARAQRFYTAGFGLTESHRMDFPTFTLLYLRDPESGYELELTLNKGQSEPYTHGSGYGHIAFAVENLAQHHEHLKSLGYAVGDIKELKAPTGTARFFFTTDPDGYKVEVLERGGHYV